MMCKDLDLYQLRNTERCGLCTSMNSVGEKKVQEYLNCMHSLLLLRQHEIERHVMDKQVFLQRATLKEKSKGATQVHPNVIL